MMGLLTDDDVTPPLSQIVRTWRVTTAVRSFALALCIGMVFAGGVGGTGNTGQLLLALLLIAGVSSFLEWSTMSRVPAWIPVGEALLVSLILVAGDAESSLFAYLAVPPVVAGVRHGIVAVVNAVFIGGVTLILTAANSSSSMQPEAAFPWLVVGLGVGFLASWLSRAARELHARRAPFAAAHQLMSQLHGLAREGEVGLDSATLAEELGASLRSATGASASAVFGASRGGGLHLISAHGSETDLVDQVMATEESRRPGVIVLPLRGADEVRGFVVLDHVRRWDEALSERATDVASEFALQLDTAVLFEDIRHMATSEERNRIAREMHDGVAQEIVALGYLVDEIESITDEPATRDVAATLRGEVSRVVTELRYSIFDLRHPSSAPRLNAALAEYINELSKGTDLRVHLVLEDSDHSPGPAVEAELLRIAQEAIGNVRRHAQAQNLWVSYSSDEGAISLVIEDDGVGHAAPKALHWGLQTMSERAMAIGATLDISERPGGGTTVKLHTGSPRLEGSD